MDGCFNVIVRALSGNTRLLPGRGDGDCDD
jgi:hypothetical protein